MLRPAAKEDCERIAQVLAHSFSTYQPLYTEEAFQATIADPAIVLKRIGEGPCWVFESRNEFAGTLSSKVTKEGLYLCGMAVHPGFRKQRIGYQLLKEAETYAIHNQIRRIFLSTTFFLLDAIRLYENFGFIKTHIPPYDLHGTPVFTMEKRFNP